MHMIKTDTATPRAPMMPITDWQRWIAYAIEDGGLDKTIRQSVEHRMRRTHEEIEVYALGRALEDLAREAGLTDLGRWLLELARACGSGMQDGDLTRAGRL